MALPRPADEITARARIRDAAFRLIAERGVRGATLRAIAEVAGVSSALVVHHYGSKQGVVDDVAAWVIDILGTAVSDHAETDHGPLGNASRIDAYATLFLSVPHLADYVRRMLLDESDEGLIWFGTVVDNTVRVLQRREASGEARRSADVRAEAVLINLISLGPILLPRHLQHIFGTSSQAAVARRWNKATAELMRSALYPQPPVKPTTAPATHGRRAPKVTRSR